MPVHRIVRERVVPPGAVATVDGDAADGVVERSLTAGAGDPEQDARMAPRTTATTARMLGLRFKRGRPRPVAHTNALQALRVRRHLRLLSARFGLALSCVRSARDEAAQTSFEGGLIRRELLDAIDDEDLDRALGGLQPETELFLDRGEERRSRWITRGQIDARRQRNRC